MRRNGYLCTSGVNLDTAVRFADPDFILGCKISAIWRRFTLIFAFSILNVRHISTSGLLDLLTSYSLLSADTSRDFVTLTFDLLILNNCCVWRVTCPTLLPSLKTVRLSVLDLWVITFPGGYHWECVRGHCACAKHVGVINNYIFGILDPDLQHLRIYYALSTYWRWNYATRVDSHVDNSHQVWSWYDHTLPSYGVFVCWYVTWPCDLDLWLFDLEHAFDDTSTKIGMMTP